MKFSGLISLQQRQSEWNLPVGYVLAVEVDECREQLLHDARGFVLRKVLAFKNVVEQLSTGAVLEHEEADFVPLPHLAQLDDVRVVLVDC